MSFPAIKQVDDLTELLNTRVALLLIETHEEKHVLALFERFANLQQRQVWSWTVRRGLQCLYGKPPAFETRHNYAEKTQRPTMELPDALDEIQYLARGAIVLFLDVHPYLTNSVVIRACKELALKAESNHHQLVLVGHKIGLPEELSPYTARFEVTPMTLERVRAVLTDEAERFKRENNPDITGCQQTLESLRRHMVGLPETAVRHLARLTLSDGVICAADLMRVLTAKQETMGAAELLVFEQNLPSLDDVAGMAALKRWLAVRREPFLSPHESGLPVPKGVLLLGVQGAGKSLAAKSIAASWQVPLFRMDFGALYDKFQGESERKLREALRVADAMSPCILWMDEIEKGLSQGDGDGDTGAGKRMLGSLLTWMAERKTSVFLVATANDIESLPPELIRKGRFDEIFFVDLPTPEIRSAIFRLHLKKNQVVLDDEAIAALSQNSEGFSGAEIEAVILSVRYEALAQQQAVTLPMLLHELQRTKPLSVTRAEAIGALRIWAADRTVKAD